MDAREFLAAWDKAAPLMEWQSLAGAPSDWTMFRVAAGDEATVAKMFGSTEENA